VSRELRRECERQLKALRLPSEDMTIDRLAAHVANGRGRALHLRPLAMGSSGISGAWIPGRSADHVFYEADTSRRHQVQIIAHELGHIICAHEPALHGSLADVARLAPGAAERMMGRDAYSDQQEREAEHMADLLVGYLDAVAAPRAPDPVQAALEHRSR
jgi:IrrE N-terminal-like domain